MWLLIGSVHPNYNKHVFSLTSSGIYPHRSVWFYLYRFWDTCLFEISHPSTVEVDGIVVLNTVSSVYNRQTSPATADIDLYKFTLWFRRWICVSLLLKDLTDSDPEPSTIERLGAGPGSGFKWESSVGEPLSHQACLALLFFYLTLIFGFNHQQLQTFPFWPVWCSLLTAETFYLACAVEMVTNSVCGGSKGGWRLVPLREKLLISRSASCFLWASGGNESQPAPQDQGWWPLWI